jgi:hypothetical protein
VSGRTRFVDRKGIDRQAFFWAFVVLKKKNRAGNVRLYLGTSQHCLMIAVLRQQDLVEGNTHRYVRFRCVRQKSAPARSMGGVSKCLVSQLTSQSAGALDITGSAEVSDVREYS